MSVGRQLAEKEKAVVRMQKANEMAQKKIQEHVAEIGTMQSAVKALTAQVTEHAANQAASEHTIAGLKTQ